MSGQVGRGRRCGGFSMIELLVTIVVAGIIFAAMVPFFANALKASSGDEIRVDSQNIAQDRIEQVRLLAYADITSGNLNYSPSPTASPFGDGRFGPTYTQVGESKPYQIAYTVDPASSPDAAQKHVTVSVSRADSSFVTTADTVINNPDAGSSTSTSGATPSALPTTNLSITCSFKNWADVTSSGVVVVRVQTNATPNVTTTPTPLKQVPNASNTTVTWTGLTGGKDYTYTVTCYSQYVTAVSPPFHLLKNARLKFDTHPGG